MQVTGVTLDQVHSWDVDPIPAKKVGPGIMIPAVFSVAGITLVVGQQIPAEILQPKVTGTASQYRHCTVHHSYGRGNLEPQTKGFTPKLRRSSTKNYGNPQQISSGEEHLTATNQK